MLSTRLAVLAALSMVVGSTAAAAQTTAPLSLQASPAIQRAGATPEGTSELDRRNGIGIYLIGAIALALIVWGIIEVTRDDEEGFPTSP